QVQDWGGKAAPGVNKGAKRKKKTTDVEIQEDAQQGLPSPEELERRFGASFLEFYNHELLPELQNWSSKPAWMSEEAKANAIMGFILMQNFESLLHDLDKRHYLTFVEARIRLFDTSTRKDVIKQ